MALIISDRVKETSVTNGVGTITLNGTYGGFQSFSSGIGDGNTTYYAIENDASWEVGIGTYTQSSNTLSRDTILKSSNSNNAISLNGVSRVFCTYPSDKAVYLDANNDIAFAGTAGFDEITAHNITVSGLSDLGNVNTSGSVVVSGDLLFYPTDQNDTFTMQRNAAGNFFHGYIDTTYDRTLALHTDGGMSPKWKLGLKTSPNSATEAPDHAYIYGIDSDMGLIANSNNSVTISNAAGFNVKHKNSTIITAHTTTGIHIDSVATAYPALTVNGGVSLAANIQEWSNSAGTVLSAVDNAGNFAIGKSTANYELDVDGSGKFGQIYLTTGIIFADGTTQTTASAGTDYSAAILDNTSSGVAHSGYFETKINNIPTATDYSTQIFTNSASGVAISGWASQTIINSGVAVSGWVNSTFDTKANTAAISGYAEGIAGGGSSYVWSISDGTVSADTISNAQTVFISGISGITTEYITGDNLLKLSAGSLSGWASSTITSEINSLVDSAPGALNTLNELAAALNDDSSFSTTVTNSIAANTTNITDNSASGVAISGWANGTFTTNSHVSNVSGWALQTIINSGVAVSGWANGTFDTTSNTTAISGWAAHGISANTTNISTNTSNIVLNDSDIAANSASGVAISGWAAYDISTNATNISTNAANIALNDIDIATNSASGVAISGWADATFLKAEVDTLQTVTDRGATTTNTITAPSAVLDVLDMNLLGNGDHPTHSEGILFYDSENHTISLYNDESDISLQIGQEQFLRVRNNTGAPILNGSGVKITGAHGNAAPTIAYAQSDIEANSQVVGLATHDIEDASFGYVTTYGIVRDVNTSTFTAGDELFLSASNEGALVNASPSIPNYKAPIGHVVSSHTSNGSILVQIGHPKLGGGDLKSEKPLYESGIPFVTSISDTIAGGSQTDPLFIYDSGNRQLQLGSGVQLLDGVPSNTSNVLYNNAGTLNWDGSEVGATPYGASGLAQVSDGAGGLIDAGFKFNTTANILHTPTTKGGSFVVAKDGVNHTVGVSCVAINNGAYSRSYGQQSIGIGNDAIASALRSVTIGNTINNTTASRVMIGAYQTALLDFAKEDGVFRISDLELHNGDDAANAAEFTVMKTWTSSTDYEGLRFGSDGTNHTIGAVSGTAGGTDRDLRINSNILVSGLHTASGSIEFLNSTPSTTTNRLYNNAGTLSWNGSPVNTDTNTTYTTGSGLTLVGTEFNVSSLGGSGSFEGLIVDKAIKTKINGATDGATITFDMNESNTHMVTLGGNRTLAVSNLASGQKFMLRLKQDTNGSRTVNWFSTIYWAEGGSAPTLTTTASKADLFGFLCTSGTEAPGGPYVDGVVIGQDI